MATVLFFIFTLFVVFFILVVQTYLDNIQEEKEYHIAFDFLGKDSIRYQNDVLVDRKVFRNVKQLMQSKAPADQVFDELNVR